MSDAAYKNYLRTYSEAERDAIWIAVLEMCDLFQNTALRPSEKLNFRYDLELAEKSLSFIMYVKALSELDYSQASRHN